MFPKISNKRATIEELEAVLGWEEDEHPRDDKGQFVSGPGSASTTDDAAFEPDERPEEVPDFDTREAEDGSITVSDPSKAMDDGLFGTEIAFQNSDGSWNEARQLLHKKVLDKRYGRKDGQELTSPRDQGQAPVFNMLGGGSGAGKSTILRTGKVNIDPNHVEINADDIKEDLPEYGQMIGDKDDRAASFAHEESSYLGKELIKQAYGNGHSFVLDGTGDGGEGGFMKKIKMARENGYRIVANYVTIPTELAVERAEKRAERTGRKVNPVVVASIHRSVSRMFEKAISEGLFDEAQLWDNTGDEPVLVLSQQEGETQTHDQGLWDSFIAKKDEKWRPKSASVKTKTSSPQKNLTPSSAQPSWKLVVPSMTKSQKSFTTAPSSGERTSPKVLTSECSTTEPLPWHHGLKQAEMPYYKNRDKLRKERDDGDHKCAKCGQKSKLQIHHKDGNPQNDSGKNVEYLCASCHTSHEWENGKTMPSKKSEYFGEFDESRMDYHQLQRQLENHNEYYYANGIEPPPEEEARYQEMLSEFNRRKDSLPGNQPSLYPNGEPEWDPAATAEASLKEAGGLDWVIEKIGSLLMQFVEGLAREAIKKMIPDAEGGIVDQAINALVESGQVTEDWDGISLNNSDEGGDDPFFAMGAVKDMSQGDAQDTLDGMGGRHSTCVDQAPDNIDDPEAWCASIVDEAEGTTYWRGKNKKHEGSYIDRYYKDVDDFLPEKTAASPQELDAAWSMWVQFHYTQGASKEEAIQAISEQTGIDPEELEAYIKENEKFRFAKKTAMDDWRPIPIPGFDSYVNEGDESAQPRVIPRPDAINEDGTYQFGSLLVTFEQSDIPETPAGEAQGGTWVMKVVGSKKAEKGSEELVDSLDEGQIQDELDERSETEAEDVKREVEAINWPWSKEKKFEVGDRVLTPDGPGEVTYSDGGDGYIEEGMYSPVLRVQLDSGGKLQYYSDALDQVEPEDAAYSDEEDWSTLRANKVEVKASGSDPLENDMDSVFYMPGGMNDADMEMQGLEDAGVEYMRGKNAYQPGMPKPETEGKYFLEGWADAELMYSGYSQSSEEDFKAESIDQFASKKTADEFEDEYDANMLRDLSFPCPACNGSGDPMGEMGGRDYYRCRECGLEYNYGEAGDVSSHGSPEFKEEEPVFNSEDDPYRDLIR